MTMETRKIGSLSVSVVGLGTNNFGFRMDEADVPAVVDAALDAGITFFDTSDSYGRSERRVRRDPRRPRDLTGSNYHSVSIGRRCTTLHAPR
jgi:aryl-alcohol dehydrogenase-like predicted oxidoreductase